MESYKQKHIKNFDGYLLSPICDFNLKTKLHILQSCELTYQIWFHFKGFNVANFQISFAMDFLGAIIRGDGRLYLRPNLQVHWEMVVFVVVIFKRIWEVQNMIVHDVLNLDAKQVERLCWKMEVDLREEEAWAYLEELERRTWTGASPNTLPIAFFRPNQSRWTTLQFMLLNLMWDGEVPGLWYDNLKCSSTLVVELLVINKAFAISTNFL